MRALFSSVFSVFLAAAITFTAAAPAQATNCGEVPEVLIILDRSGSMQQLAGSQSKWSIAKTAVDSLTSKFKDQIAFGLMLFPQWPHVAHCTTGQINVAPAVTSGPTITTFLSSAYPDGDTPSTNSIKAARTWLAGHKTAGKDQFVILITDGKETCCPDWPNTATGPLYSQDGVKTYVIGFGGGVLPSSLTDAAIAGGTDKYYQADNSTQLDSALSQIAGGISCCGNGDMDAGEKCDTAINPPGVGACPKVPNDCNDNDPNTQDFIAGQGCNAYCSHAGGGPAVCGNGKVEAGEWCDTAIPQGQAGACPLSCDDGNACTADVIMGKDCLAYCTNTPITTPQSGDGCCPAGASAMNDTDCPADCGNGVLEPGEKCDPGIAAGAAGACPKVCDDDGDPCTKTVLAGSACDVRCETTTLQANPGAKDGCCPKGLTEKDDSDCLPPCTPDRTTDCIDPCKDVKCPDGQYCKSGKCVPWPNGNNGNESNTGASSTVSGGCDCRIDAADALPAAWPLILIGLFLAFRPRRRR
ncbi:MAG: VWA domain-containing protein [Deltaproteobacteria bacterium]|nr:VWA domain-containing protein [Deltaproteobacteria bacterium]